jgi:molybdopterin synthase sulfur carrier subunit
VDENSLNTAHDEINVISPVSISSIKKQLIEKYGERHFPDNILCAVNHEMVNESTKVCESDEVAFFPPVTGG